MLILATLVTPHNYSKETDIITFLAHKAIINLQIRFFLNVIKYDRKLNKAAKMRTSLIVIL